MKEQEDSMVSLTKAKTEDEERAAVQDEVTSLEKLDAMNAFDTTNPNGKILIKIFDFTGAS